MVRIPEPPPSCVWVIVDRDGMPWDSWRDELNAEHDRQEAEDRDAQREEKRRLGPYRIVRYVLPENENGEAPGGASRPPS